MRRTRFMFTWLLTLALPFQVLTAVYLDVRGPLHFHAASGIDQHRHHGPESAGGGGSDYGHYLPHFHGHQQAARHHHHPRDASVVTVRDAGLLDSFTLTEETASGWSGIMLLALLATASLLWLPGAATVLALRPQPVMPTPLSGRLERPPRRNPA